MTTANAIRTTCCGQAEAYEPLCSDCPYLSQFAAAIAQVLPLAPQPPTVTASQTPRTDAAAFDDGLGDPDVPQIVVHADFARGLERSLAEAQREIERLRNESGG